MDCKWEMHDVSWKTGDGRLNGTGGPSILWQAELVEVVAKVWPDEFIFTATNTWHSVPR